jgi:hypothetical protein
MTEYGEWMKQLHNPGFEGYVRRQLRARINPAQMVSESGALEHYCVILSSGVVTAARLTRCVRASCQRVDTQCNSQALHFYAMCFGAAFPARWFDNDNPNRFMSAFTRCRLIPIISATVCWVMPCRPGWLFLIRVSQETTPTKLS